MKLLLHVCCAPCAIYPFEILKKEGLEITGFFYNPNIHPYTEYKKRLNGLKEYSSEENFLLLSDEDYSIEIFLKNIASLEGERCRYCYFSRMNKAAQMTISGGYDGFSTTLLYSKYQNHEMIKAIGKSLATNYNINFFYHDFREGWLKGQERAKQLGMYRQAYCGCIYSEKERYYSSKKS